MIADLRMLNAATKRKPYLLPRLQDIFWRRRGYSYMTKLDLTMQYYCFELDEDSKNLCVIVSPWGKYRYEVLPMGLTNSPDWAQSAMEQLFDDMRHDIECYLDDIGIFDTDWKNHIAKLEQSTAGQFVRAHNRPHFLCCIEGDRSDRTPLAIGHKEPFAVAG